MIVRPRMKQEPILLPEQRLGGMVHKAKEEIVQPAYKR
jgi:hypothetical protein